MNKENNIINSNEPIELSVVSTLMFDVLQIPVYRDKLLPIHLMVYRRILQALYSMVDLKEKINKSSLYKRVFDAPGEMNDYEKNFFDVFLYEKNKDRLEENVTILINEFHRAQVRSVMEKAIMEIPESVSIDGLVLKIKEKLDDVFVTAAISKPQRIGDSASQYVDESLDSKGQVKISFGDERVDYLTDSVKGGRLIIFSGKSGSGKTSIVVHFLKKIAMQKCPVAILSLEMGHTEVAVKVLSSVSKISRRSIADADLNPVQYLKIQQSLEEMSTMDFYIQDSCYSMESITEYITLMAVRYGVKVVAVDYLGLIDRKRDDEQNDFTRQLKVLAKKLKIDIILLAQMIKTAPGQKPQPKDVRYIDIHDADYAALFYPDIYRDKPVVPPSDYGTFAMCLDFVKCRGFGDKAIVSFIYDNNTDTYYSNNDEYYMAKEEAKATNIVVYNPLINKRGDVLVSGRFKLNGIWVAGFYDSVADKYMTFAEEDGREIYYNTVVSWEPGVEPPKKNDEDIPF